jgi:hypothetical protein
MEVSAGFWMFSGGFRRFFHSKIKRGRSMGSNSIPPWDNEKLPYGSRKKCSGQNK